MAIAAAQLAASSVAPQFATPLSSAPVFRASSSGISFALRRLQSIGGSSRIGGRISTRDGLARVKLLPIKAAAPEEAGEEFKRQAKEVFDDLKSKWDGVGNKSSVALIGSGAFLALWFSSTVVNTINNVPLLPNLMELIGLAYSAWFFYRYLLFQDNRKELAAELKELKHKITGTTDDISNKELKHKITGTRQKITETTDDISK